MEESPSAVLATPDHYRIGGGEREYVAVDPENLFSLVAAGILYQTAAVEANGGFRPFFWEEHDLHLRLRDAGEFVHVPEPLYTYRQHGENRTHNDEKVLNGWLALIEEWGTETVREAGSAPGLDEALKYVDAEPESE